MFSASVEHCSSTEHCCVKNRRKAPRECPPHQIQPQVARSSIPGARYGTPTVLGTAIATRPPVLWLPEYIRGALRGSCGTPRPKSKESTTSAHFTVGCSLKSLAPPALGAGYMTLAVRGTAVATRAAAARSRARALRTRCDQIWAHLAGHGGATPSALPGAEIAGKTRGC